MCLTLLAAITRADELDALVRLAFSNSPVIKATRERVLQAEAAHEASDEFFDAGTRATAGRTSGDYAPPLLSSPSGLPPADAYGASAAVEVPVQPGLYAGVGVSEQYLMNPSADRNHVTRTLIGAQIRIPLLQDRGFYLWKQDRARLAGLQEAAGARLTEAHQSVRHAVEQAYIAYLEGLANGATSAAATERSQQLLKEAEELVRLKVVPEYQLAPARLELALRHEEARAFQQTLDTARLRLIQVLGRVEPAALTTNVQELVERAARARLPAEPAMDRAVASRGTVRELDALASAAAAESRALADRLSPDLALTLRGTWETDESSSASGDGALADGESTSTAALLVWTHPFRQTGPRARLRESKARETELVELYREVRDRLATDLLAAYRDFSGARDRLEQINMAVEQARHTLEAEAERFRLGEGRSRNVLDAQNDLTKAYRARTAIVAALLRRHSDYLYAAGYNPDDSQAAGVPPLGDSDRGYQ
jgi:outer membrane protein TolC